MCVPFQSESRFKLAVGICVPDTCSREDVQRYVWEGQLKIGCHYNFNYHSVISEFTDGFVEGLSGLGTDKNLLLSKHAWFIFLSFYSFILRYFSIYCGGFNK